jgi:hypothetical protein
MNNLLFALSVILETRIAPLLLLWRRLLVGYPYRKIPLTQNRFARVDPEDYAALARHKWSAARQGRTIYAVRSHHGVQIRMHRVIMKAPRGLVCDHIDHDGSNNTKRNLRLCTRNQNGKNQRRRTDGRSKYKGVSWHKGDGRWHARIYHNGRCHHLGRFRREIDAARAYDRAARRLHGSFASLNFPRRRRIQLPATNRLIRRWARRRVSAVEATNQPKEGARQ